MTRSLRFAGVLAALMSLVLVTGCELVTGAVGSDDNNLLSLSIKDSTNAPVVLSPGFSPSTRDYTATVANAIQTVSVTPVASDGKARVVVIGGDANLAVGPNIIQVVVTAENGKKANYTVTLTRLAPVAVNGVTLNLTSQTVTVGDSPLTLTATVDPSNAANQSLSWAVANNGSNAALSATSGTSVSLNLGTQAGTATVTVTTADGGKTATAVITINAAAGPVLGTLVITNNTSLTIDFLYVALTSASDWGANYLPVDSLLPGNSFTLTDVPAGVYDIRALDIHQNVVWDTFNSGSPGYLQAVTMADGQTIQYSIH